MSEIGESMTSNETSMAAGQDRALHDPGARTQDAGIIHYKGWMIVKKKSHNEGKRCARTAASSVPFVQM